MARWRLPGKKQPKGASPRSEGVETLLLHLRADGLPAPVTEHRFAEPRMWRFDLCWPAAMLAVEVDGAAWIQGRHQRPQGFTNDCTKCNAAVKLGWRILRYTTEMVKSGAAINDLKAILGRAH